MPGLPWTKKYKLLSSSLKKRSIQEDVSLLIDKRRSIVTMKSILIRLLFRIQPINQLMVFIK
jgi:hypothetical protein